MKPPKSNREWKLLAQEAAATYGYDSGEAQTARKIWRTREVLWWYVPNFLLIFALLDTIPWWVPAGYLTVFFALTLTNR